MLRSFVSGSVAERLMESDGQLTEERRLVTALFADLSGFTVLASRMDPEQLSEVIDPVIAGLTDIVGEYGGYVEKFAGDALLAFFGAPVAHEDDADRALKVALAMHERLQGLVRVPDAELTLHVGINTGHVIARVIGSEVRMDYAVLGEAVILAQRIESVTPSGETYVGTLTHHLTQARFILEPVGPFTLKGRAEPEAAWRLVGPKGAAEASVTGLVGREPELAQLTGLLEASAASCVSVGALVGGPGVGKTRLLEELRARAGDLGMQWIQVQCAASGGSIPYRPYVDLLLRGIRGGGVAEPADDSARLDDLLARLGLQEHGPFLRSLLGLPAQAPLDLEPEALGRAIDDALLAWVGASASRTPTVLVLEDVHWADPSSASLTRRLPAACAEVPLALLVTGRPEARPEVDAIVAASAGALVLELHGIDGAALAALVEQVLGGQAAPELDRLVIERSSGNPLFALELMRSLQERGALVARDGVWGLAVAPDAVDVPPTLEGLLAARMDLLSRDAIAVLQLASVIGRRSPLPLLRAAAGHPECLDTDLAVLYQAQLLNAGADGAATFTHSLVQDVAYSRLLRRKQRELHLRVAEAAERTYGPDESIELLARHLYLAREGARAIPYLEKAGRRALALFANDEARTHLERALELARETSGFEELVPELLVELAGVCALTGRYDESLRHYEEVRALAPDVRAWRGSADVLRALGRYGDALALIEDALREQSFQGDEAAALLLERGRCLLSEAKFAAAAAALREGLAIASPDSEVTAHLLLQLTRAEVDAGDPVAALAHGQRALDVLLRRDDPRALATALRVLGGVYDVLGRLDEAAESLRLGLGYAERVGNVEEIGACLLNLGLVEGHRGRHEAAIDATHRALAEFTRVGLALGMASAAANLAEALIAVDRFDDAEGYCEQALTLAADIGDELTLADARLTRAIARMGLGRHAEAEADAEQAAAAFADLGITAYADRGRELAARARETAGQVV